MILAIPHQTAPEAPVDRSHVCDGCRDTGRVPLAEWMVRGGTSAPDWSRYPLPRTAFCPDCHEPSRLITVEMTLREDRADPERRTARFEVHLAGDAANGGTGPNLCGFDRFARDASGRLRRGFSVGGGVSGGPDYPGSHQACGDCAAVVNQRPISGTHRDLFDTTREVA